jgi:transcriptional regulator with XRE-family HTH domain
VEFKAAPEVTPRQLVRVRQRLRISRALFAVYLRTNVRTLENWEQGRAKPNAQAALLINLVKRFPDTAVVMDCELAGHYWVKVDTGELVPPDEVWPAGPGHIVDVGLRQTLVLRDGRWLIASSEVDPGACG